MRRDPSLDNDFPSEWLWAENHNLDGGKITCRVTEVTQYSLNLTREQEGQHYLLT